MDKKRIRPEPDPLAVALRFNGCINKRDLAGLAELMTVDHVFIDRADEVSVGKEVCVEEVWRPFFRLFPDYRNVFEKSSIRENEAILEGYSVCSDERLSGVKAIWVAETREGKVSRWQIYDDTERNRKLLGIE